MVFRLKVDQKRGLDEANPQNKHMAETKKIIASNSNFVNLKSSSASPSIMMNKESQNYYTKSLALSIVQKIYNI